MGAIKNNITIFCVPFGLEFNSYQNSISAQMASLVPTTRNPINAQAINGPTYHGLGLSGSSLFVLRICATEWSQHLQPAAF